MKFFGQTDHPRNGAKVKDEHRQMTRMQSKSIKIAYDVVVDPELSNYNPFPAYLKTSCLSLQPITMAGILTIKSKS